MPTILRAHGLRFVVYVDDHPPAHVHVIGGGGEAKVDLGVADGQPTLIDAVGLDRATLRKALIEVVARREEMLAAWRRIHGTAGSDRR